MPVYQAVYCHTPEDHSLRMYYHENVKSQMIHVAGWNQFRMETTGGA